MNDAKKSKFISKITKKLHNYVVFVIFKKVKLFVLIKKPFRWNHRTF